jgi:hypothetical protein
VLKERSVSNGQQKAWLYPIWLKLTKTRAFSSIMSLYLPKTGKRGFGILDKKTKRNAAFGVQSKLLLFVHGRM